MQPSLLLGAGLAVGSAFAAETNQPATLYTKVKEGPFKIKVTLDGRFAARHSAQGR